MAKKKFIPRPKESEKVIKNRWSKKRESIETLSNNIQRLRYNVSVDLKSDNEKIFLTALVVAMMLKTGERVGNELSASNGHVGITGLKKEQVNVIGNKIILEYVGKSGVEHDKSFSDEKIAKALKIAKKKNKNDSIFVTSKGFKIKNNRINRYLSDFEITTKDIRGFSSNSWVIKKLKEVEPEETESKRNKQFNSIVKKIALKVGHGAATLKKHYLVPELQPNFVEFGKVIEVDDLVKYNDGGVVGSGEKTKKIEIKEQEPIVEKTENVIEEEVESAHERFELDETKSIDDVYSNVDKIAVQYANRKMAAIQVESYLNEVDKSLSKEFVAENEINNRDGLFDFVSKRQVLLRKGKGKERSEVLKKIKNEKTQSHTDSIVKMALEQEEAMQKSIQKEEEKEGGRFSFKNEFCSFTSILVYVPLKNKNEFLVEVTVRKKNEDETISMKVNKRWLTIDQYDKFISDLKERQDKAESIEKDNSKVLENDVDAFITPNEKNSNSDMDKGGSIKDDKKTIFTEWKSLVNMSAGEVEKFMHTEEGKEAGLSKKEADDLGIHNGRESAIWIIKMKSTPVSEWTENMWDWAKRQISFIKRMTGNEGKLYDDKGNKTRKYTSLLIWGNNPEKYENGGGVEKNEEYIVKLKSTMSKGGSLTVKNKQVYGDDKPLRDFSLDEAKPFMSVWHEEKGNWFYAKDTFYIWFYDEKDSGAKISSGEFDFLLFPPPIKYQSVRLGYGVVDSIWRAQYQNKYKGAKNLLGMVEGWYDEKNNTVIVKYMSVKPSAKRNRINSFMVMYAKQVFGVESVEFNEPSDEGAAFSEAKTYEDFKPKISVSYNDNNELLAKAKTLGHNITGIYIKSFKGHEELFLFEIAQQANTDEVSKDGAIKVAGSELVEIALLLYPNVKIGDKFFSVSSDGGKKYRSGGSLPMHYIKVTTKDGDYIGAIKFNPNNQERVNNLAELASTAKSAGYKLIPIDIETYRELIKKIDYDKLKKYQEDMILVNNTSSGLHDKSFENGGEMEEYHEDMEENHDMFEEIEHDYMVDYLIKNKDQYQDKFQNDKRFILSHEKEIIFQEREYPERLSHKPNGLWYAFGMEWINDVGSFAPSLASVYKFVHEIKVNDNILILNTIEEAIEFTEKYGAVYNPSSIMNYYYIDWKKVAEDYSGIEVMNPYFWSREWTYTIVKDGVEKKYNTHELLFWLRSWDSSSGCVWKNDGIESIENVFDYKN